jgi:hypothetical protein
MKDAEQYLKFNGSLSELKYLGFEFCKLFADNRMQWNYEDFRIWKRDSILTIDCIRGIEILFFKKFTQSFKSVDDIQFNHDDQLICYTYGKRDTFLDLFLGSNKDMDAENVNLNEIYFSKTSKDVALKYLNDLDTAFPKPTNYEKLSGAERFDRLIDVSRLGANIGINRPILTKDRFFISKKMIIMLLKFIDNGWIEISS